MVEQAQLWVLWTEARKASYYYTAGWKFVPIVLDVQFADPRRNALFTHHLNGVTITILNKESTRLTNTCAETGAGRALTEKLSPVVLYRGISGISAIALLTFILLPPLLNPPTLLFVPLDGWDCLLVTINMSSSRPHCLSSLSSSSHLLQSRFLYKYSFPPCLQH